MKMARYFLFLLNFCVFSFIANAAIYGTCTYDEGECSCHYGQPNQGTCWDYSSGPSDDATCTSRSCNAGWTCGCKDRTHVCSLKDQTHYVPDVMSPDGTTATCHQEAMKGVGGVGAIVELGSHSISFSKNGLLANACQNLYIWHNGEVLASWSSDLVTNSSNIDQHLEDREEALLIDYKPGDLLAFRFKSTSYHCFSGYAEFVVDGTTVDTRSTGVSATFAKQHSTDWFKQDFPVVYNSDESTASPTEFVPLRTRYLSSGDPIVPGVDNWQPPDGTEDHKNSNFYFRIQL